MVSTFFWKLQFSQLLVLTLNCWKTMVECWDLPIYVIQAEFEGMET